MALENKLRGMTFWMVDDSGDADHYASALMTSAAATTVVLSCIRDLNVLSAGETCARTLGVPMVRACTLIYVVASPCTAVAVTIASSVVSVDLLVPYMACLT